MSESGLPVTPARSRATPTTSSSSIQGSSEVRSIMAHNGIVIDDFESEPPLIQPLLDLARGIVSGTRGSVMRPESKDNIQEVRKMEASSNETTFLVHFMNALLQPQRHVLEAIAAGHESEESQEWTVPVAPGERGPRTDAEPTTTVAVGGSAVPAERLNRWTERKWDKDGLKVNWCADFTSVAVPRLSDPDPLLAALLARSPRVATPRPDICYGLQKAAFTEAEQAVNSAHPLYTCVSRGCFHAFFLVECKMLKVEEAENQVARGGATLVNARRRFNAHDPEQASMQRRLGVDLESFAFSLVLTPNLARLFINWAEVLPSSISPSEPSSNSVVNLDSKIIYHATALITYSFSRPAGVLSCIDEEPQTMGPIERLRHDINNILDWGTMGRKIKIKQVSKAIAETMKGEKRGRDGE